MPYFMGVYSSGAVIYFWHEYFDMVVRSGAMLSLHCRFQHSVFICEGKMALLDTLYIVFLISGFTMVGK